MPSRMVANCDSAQVSSSELWAEKTIPIPLLETPSKSFFQRDYRALSHGCMRVQNPWNFAATLLEGEPNVTVSALKAMVGGPERQVPLARHIPVHITYFTAWVDGDGTLQIRNDLYGHDKHMEQMLGLS